MSEKSSKGKQKSMKGKGKGKPNNKSNTDGERQGKAVNISGSVLKMKVEGGDLFEPSDHDGDESPVPKQDGMDNLAYTMMLVHKAADKLLQESEKLRVENRDGIADMTNRVDGIEIRMGSDTGSMMSQASLGSPTASMMTMGSVRSSASGMEGNGGMTQMLTNSGMTHMVRLEKYQQNFEKFSRDMAQDLHKTTDIHGDVHEKRVESVSIIKGAGKKKTHHFLWTQNDRLMCFGFLPTDLYGWKKNYLELVTLFFVMMSVLLIVVQSYPAFDPHCVSEYVEFGQAVLGNYTNRTIYTCHTSNHNEEVTGYFEIFYIQLALVLWFTVEYFLRFMAVRPNWKVHRPYSAKEYWKSKLAHVCSFMTMIDLLSISPFYIERMIIASGGDPSGAGSVLTVLRVIRILRVFKMTKSNQTLTDLFAAFRIIADDMIVILVLLITMMTLLSTGMYYAERGVEHATRYDGEVWFDTIMDTFYWCAITLTSVGYGDVRPSTRPGRVIAAFSAIMSVLVINLPIAIIIMSFDEVYRIRRGRELRATLVTKRLFKWVDRAKMATEKAKHPRKHDVKVKKDQQANADRAKARADAADLADDSESRPVTPAVLATLTLRVVGMEPGEGLTLKQLTRKSRQIERDKRRKRRDEAMRTMKRLILNPGTSTREMANGIYNGQEHYLASKYFTIWEDRTLAGRKVREKIALGAIKTLVNNTEGTLHQQQKNATLKWMKSSKGVVSIKKKKAKKAAKSSFGDMRMRSSNKRGKSSSFGAAHGMKRQGRPTIGLAFGKIHIDRSLSDMGSSSESEYDN